MRKKFQKKNNSKTERCGGHSEIFIHEISPKKIYLIYLSSIIGPNRLDGLIMIYLPLQRDTTWIRLGRALNRTGTDLYTISIYLFAEILFYNRMEARPVLRALDSIVSGCRFFTVQSQVAENFWLDFLYKKMQLNSFKYNTETLQSGLTFFILFFWLMFLYINSLVFAVPIIPLLEIVYICQTVMTHESAIKTNMSPRNYPWTIDYLSK